MTLSREEPLKLGRRNLQKYAMPHGVKANKKDKEIIEALLANAEAHWQELKNETTREQEAPSTTIKQEEEEIDDGLAASKSCGSSIRALSLAPGVADAARQEPIDHERMCQELFARIEVRAEEGAVFRANAAAHLPTPGDTDEFTGAGQGAQSQSGGSARSARPSTAPLSPVTQPQAHRPLTPISPKPEIPRVGPNFAHFEQRKPADEQNKESVDPRPVVKRTVQGAPVGMKTGEWSHLMNRISDFENTRLHIVDAVDGINVLVGRAEGRLMGIAQRLDAHRRVRHQLERHLAAMYPTTSNLNGGSEDDEPRQSPQQEEMAKLGKRQRDSDDEGEDNDEDDGDDVFGSPSYKRRRTGQ